MLTTRSSTSGPSQQLITGIDFSKPNNTNDEPVPVIDEKNTVFSLDLSSITATPVPTVLLSPPTHSKASDEGMQSSESPSSLESPTSPTRPRKFSIPIGFKSSKEKEKVEQIKSNQLSESKSPRSSPIEINSPRSGNVRKKSGSFSKSLENLHIFPKKNSPDNSMSPRLSKSQSSLERQLAEKTAIESDFPMLESLSGDKAENFDKGIHLDEWTYNTKLLCNEILVRESIETLLLEICNQQPLQNLFCFKNKIGSNARILDVINAAQNKLISATPVYLRLKQSMKVLTDYFETNNAYTLFTAHIYAVLKELIALAEASGPEKLPVEGLCTFIKKIENFSTGEQNKKIKSIVSRFLGDSSGAQKEVMQILKEWTDSGKQILQYGEKVHSMILAAVAKDIDKVEHLWDELLEHFFDKISPKDLCKYYMDLTVPANINDDVSVFMGTSNNVFSDLMIGLYKTFGFVLDANKKMELFRINNITNWEDAQFSEQTLQCVRLLKMGLVNTRAEDYLRNRLEGLFEKSFIMKNTPVSLQFHVDKNIPENSYVEQMINFKICSKDAGEPVYCIIPVSWKVFFPVDNTLNCGLRMLKIDISEEKDLNPDKMSELKEYLINFTDDASIEKKLGGIKIGHQIVNI